MNLSEVLAQVLPNVQDVLLNDFGVDVTDASTTGAAVALGDRVIAEVPTSTVV